MMGQPSYYRNESSGITGKTYHSECTDPLRVKAAVAAERERCAKIAEEWLETFGAYTPEHVSAQKWASDAVRDIAAAIRKSH
jgi:hypothetical protein